MLICLAGTGAGCTRMFFRKQADREVDAVLREKDIFSAWKIEQMHVYPDPRARHGDTTNPDRPPMPPDDPAARKLGPNPQKPRHAGVARVEGTGYLDLLAEWDMHNRAERAAVKASNLDSVAETLRTVAHLQKKDEQPELIPEPKPIDGMPKVKTNPYLIRIEQAMEMGLINSREFQTRREDLYLTALPVTRERFAFGPQYFAIEQIVRERTGASLPLGEGDRWSYGSTVGLSKLFSTGALLLMGFANDTVVELNNPLNRYVTSTSTANLDIIQPLLRGGGKAANLEPLTQVERNLLYEIRDYARFRKQYYQYMIGGPLGGITGLPGIGVTTPGNLSAIHPLPASLAAGSPARQQILPITSGTLALGIRGIAPTEGFLPNIFKASVLQNEAANLKRLNEVMKLFVAYESGGIISNLQVGQVELQRLQAISTVLQREQDLRDSLDDFKQQLGVPVTTQIELDDTVLRPISDQFAQYDAIGADYEATIAELGKLDQSDKVRGGLAAILTDSRLAKGTKRFQATMLQRWQRWGKIKENKTILEELEKDSAIKRDLERNEEKLSAKEKEQLREVKTEIALGILELAVRRYEVAPLLKRPNEGPKRDEQAARWRDVRNAFILILAEAGSERFAILRARWAPAPRVIVGGVDLIDSDVESAYEIGAQTALDNRLDLMNSRAQVTDAWRQLRVFANSLLGTFTVGYHMDSSTPPDSAKPLAFQPSQTRHQLGLNFELPLVRITERNAYRASQIAYQRARRNLDQHEDQIVSQVRFEIRQLQVLAKNISIQQKAIEIAYQQLDSSLETFRAPQAPNQGGNPDANAFALTQQLLGAYRGLPQAQNQLMKTWIDYHVLRQQLYLDLELMPLDARGVWIDEFSNPPGRQRELQPQPAGSFLGTPQPVAGALP